jgi:hypothetical protein
LTLILIQYLYLYQVLSGIGSGIGISSGSGIGGIGNWQYRQHRIVVFLLLIVELLNKFIDPHHPNY